MVKQVKITLAAVLLFVATSLAVVGSMVSASAIAGCDGPVYFKSNVLHKTHTTVVLTYDPLDVPWRSQKWHYEASMNYWFCPRGDQPDWIQFDSFALCVMKGDNVEANNMRGFKFDVFTNNDFQRTNHPGIQSRDWPLGAGNTGDERCWTQDFDQNLWLMRSSHPYWNLEVWANLAFQPDDDIPFGDAYLLYGYDPDAFTL